MQAAKRLLRKLLKKQIRPPRVMITDKLASYGAAKREVMPGIEHRQHKGLNNRAENSHQPTCRRDRQMSSSNRPARRSGSSQPTIRSTTSSISAAIMSLPPSTELPGPRNSRSGLKSAVWVGNKFLIQLPLTQIQLTRCDKLTVPPDLFEQEEPGTLPSLLPKEQLATLLEAPRLEISVALAARKIGDDQDDG